MKEYFAPEWITKKKGRRPRIAVTGCRGRLGAELINHGCIPIDTDITDIREVQKVINHIQPTTIINCAAVTDVDGCETTDIFRRALKVNGAAVNVLRSCFFGQLIHVSTDFIFDGKKDGLYTEEDKPNPINQYGLTKLFGEENVLEDHSDGDVIVRTTVLYGGYKPDFLTAVLDKLEAGKPFAVTDSLYGTPTFIPHLVRALLKLTKVRNPPKILNLAGTDLLSRYEFAQRIGLTFGYGIKNIRPTKKCFGLANRPKNVGLCTKKAKKLNLPLYSVQEGLEKYKLTRSIHYLFYAHGYTKQEIADKFGIDVKRVQLILGEERV